MKIDSWGNQSPHACHRVVWKVYHPHQTKVKIFSQFWSFCNVFNLKFIRLNNINIIIELMVIQWYSIIYIPKSEIKGWFFVPWTYSSVDAVQNQLHMNIRTNLPPKGYNCSERALTLYILGISLGGWQDMYTERLVDSVVDRPHHVMTSSCVVRGDSRLCPEVTREHQSILRSWGELGPVAPRRRKFKSYILNAGRINARR